MPIERDILDVVARTFVSAMTSIRGRRVHRLLMRELPRFDHVLPTVSEDGTPALLALAEDGRAAVCRTDGRGGAAAVVEWVRLEGLTITIAYDLSKDSLPIMSWTIWHPSFARAAGALTLSASDFSPTAQRQLSDILRRFGA